MAKGHKEGRSGQSSGKRSGVILSVLFRFLGTVILLLVILTALPVAAPRFLGYQAFTVVSGSMEPELPVGSLAYVKVDRPADVEDGDIIAFNRQDSVVIHRVVKNHMVEGTFTTKGDANEKEDPDEVLYANYIGRVEKHIPVLGQMLAIYMTNLGRICVFCLAVCGFLMNILAGRLDPK